MPNPDREFRDRYQSDAYRHNAGDSRWAYRWNPDRFEDRFGPRRGEDWNHRDARDMEHYNRGYEAGYRDRDNGYRGYDRGYDHGGDYRDADRDPDRYRWDRWEYFDRDRDYGGRGRGRY